MRKVWARASVFEGEFDEAAAVFVCAGGDMEAGEVSSALAHLVLDSVIEAVRDPGGVRPGRYLMTDAVREYGAGLLHQAGEAAVAADLYRAYADRIAQHAQALWVTGQSGNALRLLEEKAHHVYAALKPSCDDRTQAAVALGIAVDLWFWWTAGGRQAQGLTILQQLLPYGPQQGMLHARASWLAGWLALHAQYPVAAELLDGAWQAAVLAGDDMTVGRCLHALGLLALADNDEDRALACLQQSVDITPESSCFGPSTALTWTALALAQLHHRPREALRCARRALAHPELRADRFARGHALYVRALAEDRLGRTGRADHHRYKALAVLEGLAEAPARPGAPPRRASSEWGGELPLGGG